LGVACECRQCILNVIGFGTTFQHFYRAILFDSLDLLCFDDKSSQWIGIMMPGNIPAQQAMFDDLFGTRPKVSSRANCRCL